MTGGGQRGERATSTTALMMNTSTGVCGVYVWRIPGMGDGRDYGVTATTTITSRKEEGGSHPTTPQMTATRELVERLSSAGRDWQRAEEGEGNVDDGGDN